MITEAQKKIVDETLAKLLEQFDSVRIFATTHDGNESLTGVMSTGGGNYYAQLGQVKEWLLTQDTYVTEHVASEQRRRREDDDGEEE